MSQPSASIVNDINGCARFEGRSGRSRHVLFDAEAVMAAEQMTGKGVLDLIAAARFSLSELVQLTIAGTQGYNRRNGAAETPLNPKLAVKFVLDCGGLAGMTKVMWVSLSKAEGVGLDLDSDPDSGGDADEDGDADDPPADGGAS